MDWPCQARLIELHAVGSAQLVIRTTMIDHAAPARPGDADGLQRLASLHRELAANEPHGVGGPQAHGRRQDRNVELVLPAPFPVGQLHDPVRAVSAGRPDGSRSW